MNHSTVEVTHHTLPTPGENQSLFLPMEHGAYTSVHVHSLNGHSEKHVDVGDRSNLKKNSYDHARSI